MHSLVDVKIVNTQIRKCQRSRRVAQDFSNIAWENLEPRNIQSWTFTKFWLFFLWTRKANFSKSPAHLGLKVTRCRQQDLSSTPSSTHYSTFCSTFNRTCRFRLFFDLCCFCMKKRYNSIEFSLNTQLLCLEAFIHSKHYFIFLPARLISIFTCVTQK